MRIRMSSTGLRPMPPPQTMQPLALDHALHGGEVEFDGAMTSIVSAVPAGEGDRPRGGLGDDEAGRRDDGDEHRRRAVAGQAPDAVLVDDGRGRPGQAAARIQHGAGERHGLAVGEPLSGASGQERRRLDRRIAALADVAQ